MGQTFILNTSNVQPGKNYTGFLYNCDNSKYVGLDAGGKWIYANQVSYAGSLCWNFVVDTNNNVTISFMQEDGTPNGSQTYLDWTNDTGACELYSSYDKISINWNSGGDTFRLMDVADMQYFGVKPGTNNELYVTSTITPANFQFVVITTP